VTVTCVNLTGSAGRGEAAVRKEEGERQQGEKSNELSNLRFGGVCRKLLNNLTD